MYLSNGMWFLCWPGKREQEGGSEGHLGFCFSREPFKHWFFSHTWCFLWLWTPVEVIRDILSDANIKYTSSQTIIGCKITHPSLTVGRRSSLKVPEIRLHNIFCYAKPNLGFPSLHSSHAGRTSRDQYKRPLINCGRLYWGLAESVDILRCLSQER